MADAPLGYDPAFLAEEVPLPRGEDPALVRLDYTHFSVGQHTGRRLAAWTAVNIDGARLVDVPRGDDWHLDERLPAQQQAGPELYARNDLDRGHLVRRRDPVWGDPATARAANRDTFAYTNAAPQAARFNQSLELWLGLEDYLLGTVEAAATRVSVLTGCVLDAADQHYRGVQVPRRFWKVATWTDASRLHSTGYLLDQSPQLEDLDLRGLRESDEPLLGAFRTFQVPVAALAEQTGLDLGPLPGADVLGRLAALAGRWRRLEHFGDIVLPAPRG